MRVSFFDRIATSMHQMCLAESDPTVDVKGIVGLAGSLSYRGGSGMRKLIA